MHYIEGGWPGSNPGVRHFFQLAKDIRFENSKLTAFGTTRRQKISCDQDANLQALIESRAQVITLFGKSWDLHHEKPGRI